MTTTNNLTTPIAPKEPYELTAHGHVRIDDYYWMRDRENPATIQYLEEENAYLEEKMAHTKGFQEDLFAEIKSRIKETDSSVPYRLDDYLYYVRYEEGKEYPIYCRKHIVGIDNALDVHKSAENLSEQIILDVNLLAEDKSYCAVARIKPSPNHELLAIATDYVGRRIYTIRFIDLRTGEWLTDTLDRSDGSFVWANDNQTVFYTTQHEETLRSDTVYKHLLGSATSEDETVYYEPDALYYVQVSKSKAKELIFINSHASVSSEVRFVAADTPNETFRVLQARESKMEYYVDYAQGHFFIMTNDEAQNFRVMKATLAHHTKEHWQELISHSKEVLIENIELFKSFFVIEERFEGLTRLRVIEKDEQGNLGKEHFIDFGEAAYTVGIDNNPEFDTEWLRYHFNSMTTPHSVFDYQLTTHHKMLRKQTEVPNVDISTYTSERIWVVARDGVKVPVSIVYKKGIKKDGNSPLLLYGYGSYGLSVDPYFSAARTSLLDRGFIYAIAHIRGSQVMGRHWYESGKYLEKQNTFNDFIDCALHLIDQKYTSPEKLVANGGSAGGLLMGAVINDRPDLFKAVVADVPFVDVVTTMLDESIPLTTGEFDEWGNPKNKEYYEYMLSYSPYDQVKEQAYPAILVTSGLHDSQVQYWEPTKWVAKLRRMKTDNHLLLLQTNMEAGHSGASGRFERLKEVALTYAFFMDQLGMELK